MWTSSLESNSPDILALCEANLDDSIDSGNFSVRVYLPLIWKDSVSHMHGLIVYVKEGLSFTWDVSLEKFADSFLCFQLALYYSASYFFFLYWVPSLSLCKFLMLFLGLSINSYDNVFVFEDFDIHHKNKLTYWRWIDRPGELGWNWCIYPSS